MTRLPLFAVAALALAACKTAPAAGYDNAGEQSYSTIPAQDVLQVAADEDAARREAQAAAEPPPPPPLDDADKAFVAAASRSGLAEIELSRVAVEKAKKPAVKEFAQKMIDQHTAVAAELTAMCNTRGVALPTDTDEATKARRAELEKKTGTKLEKAYATMMVEDHRKAVELFRTQASSGTDAELKRWAEGTLPKLEEHLAHAEAIAKGKAYTSPVQPPAQASTEATPGGATPAVGTTPPAGSAPTPMGSEMTATPTPAPK